MKTQTQEKLNFNNPVKVECFDKDGNLKWTRETVNGISDEGIEYLLGLGFRNIPTTKTPWYIGLVDNSGFSAFAPGDTMASHTGWTVFIAYSEATRPEWTAGAPATRAITNAVTVDFTINGGGGTVKGIFIVDENTKSGTTGTLWSTAAFSSPATVVATDELKITYTVSG